MKNRLFSLLTLLLVFAGQLLAEGISILPYPNSIIVKKGNYEFGKCEVSYSSSLKFEGEYLTNLLKEEFGVCSKKVKKNANIQLVLTSDVNNKEGYKLNVNNDGVKISASSSAGIFYGIQTLRQLLKNNQGSLSADYVNIEDQPAFIWRSFMLDEGRYFKGKAEVKKLLDEMAVLKMNTFHWHLTEDQGWRIEIKKYPELTKVGSRRDSTQINWYESTVYDSNPHVGFYTQEDVKEIVKYASDRHITIIPEIEMPGHSSAAIAAYPWLGALKKKISVPCSFGVKFDVFDVGDPRVREFLRDVLDEVVELFPSKIIHIGGDEVRFDQWKSSSHMKQYMEKNNLHNYAEVHVHFTNEMSNYLQSKGKRTMGWNDIMGEKLHGFQEGSDFKNTTKLASDAIVQFWVGESAQLEKAARKGYDVVNSYHEYTYLNYNHDKITPGLEYSFKPLPLMKAYKFSPVPKDFPKELRSKIIGPGCQMWGEWIPTAKSMYKMVYPYWAAHAETGWTRDERKDYRRFTKALPYFVNRWIGKGYISLSDPWMKLYNDVEFEDEDRMVSTELKTSYVMPERIVWTSDAKDTELQSVRHLLTSTVSQTHTGIKECCRLDSHHGKTPGFLLDFGKELHGGIQLSTAMMASTDPIKIRLRFGESVSEAMSNVVKDGKGLSSATNDHAVRDMVVELPWLGNLEIGNTGFRFVRIDLIEPDRVLLLNSVKAVSKYRDLPYLGSFISNDNRLNEIWRTGAYTVHLNMQDYLWDGIKRDRLVWMGDLHPEVMAVNTVFGNQNLVNKSLDFVRDRTPQPEWMNGLASYSLWWIIIQKDLYLYQGNYSYLDAQKDYLSKLLTQIEANINDAGAETYPSVCRFLDWPTVGNNEVMHAGLQSLTVMAVNAASQIAGWLSDSVLQKQCDSIKKKLSNYHLEIPVNNQAASLASLAGIADATQMSDIVLKNGLNAFSTFYGYYMLQCLAQAGHYDEALDIIVKYWGAMLDLGATSFWENFNYAELNKASRIDELVPAGAYDIHADGGAHCFKGLRHSLCHGWASGPTSWLSQYVLGIQPMEPGCKVVKIAPHLGHLKWVKGTFPTPYGLIEVEHRLNTDGTISTSVNAPDEVKIVR